MARNPSDESATPAESRPRRIRLTGRLICELTLRAPIAWPLIRPKVERFFGERAADWDARTGAGGPAHLTAFATALLSVRPGPERVLEIGCGTGEAGLFLAREFPSARIRGVDISAEMIAKAQAKIGLDPEGRVAFRQADAHRLPFDDATFDLVAQLDAPLFAREARRVLRPGGYFVVASSRGEDTPFHTCPEKVDTRMRELGLDHVASGESGPGTFYVGWLPPSQAEYSSSS